jgi:hypothetical protein
MLNKLLTNKEHSDEMSLSELVSLWLGRHKYFCVIYNLILELCRGGGMLNKLLTNKEHSDEMSLSELVSLWLGRHKYFCVIYNLILELCRGGGMVDALVLGTSGRNSVEVRVLSSAYTQTNFSLFSSYQ